jgi:hypothetical protein
MGVLQNSFTTAIVYQQKEFLSDPVSYKGSETGYMKTQLKQHQYRKVTNHCNGWFTISTSRRFHRRAGGGCVE